MLQSVLVLSLLLVSGSAAPPPAVFPVVGVASRQTPPTAAEAPPSVVVEVEDTNITLSFAIFIVAEEEEDGSGTDGRGRSDTNSDSSESNDITDDVSRERDLQPMKEEYDGHMMRDQPMSPDDFNNSSSEVTELNQGPDNQSSSRGDRPDLDPGSQEDTGPVHQDRAAGSSRVSISKNMGLGSRLQKVFRSIQEVLDLLSGTQGVESTQHKVLGSTPKVLPGFTLSSDESPETFSKNSPDPKPQAGPDPDSDESLEATDSSIQQDTGSVPQDNVLLDSDSSEEESVGAPQVVGSMKSKVQSPEVSSSSEEVLSAPASSSSPPQASSPVPPIQTLTEAEPERSRSPDSGSESDSGSEPDSGSESDSGSEPDSPGHQGSGMDSLSSELHPDPPSDSRLSPESDYNPGQGVRADVSSEPVMDPEGSDSEAGVILETTTDSSSTAAAVFTTGPVGSAVSPNANTDTGSEFSVEDDEDDEDDGASTESAVSVKPTATENTTNPPDSRTDTDSPAPNQYDNMASFSPAPPLPPPAPPLPLPPRRRRPYRFGLLGPIAHIYHDQPVAMETAASSHSVNRRLTAGRRPPMVADPAESSSGETNE